MPGEKPVKQGGTGSADVKEAGGRRSKTGDDSHVPALPQMRISSNWLVSRLLAERERWFLWAPVWLAAGAVFYFSWQEALQIMTIAIMAAGGSLLYVGVCWWRLPAFFRIGTAICMLVGFGMLASAWRVERVDAPQIVAGLAPSLVTGRVIQYDLAAKGARVVLDHVLVEGVPAAETPREIRLRLTRYSAPPPPGATIMVKAMLMPPPGPAAPGTHDFHRDAYFDGIGGSGFAVGRPQLLEADSGKPLVLEVLRQRITGHIAAALGSTPAAAIANAYLTGERGLIDEATADDMRNSGLAHLLAISGMKVGLVAVLVFAAIRLLAALLPRVTSHVSGRKAGAVGGIAAAIGYTLLAAAPIPALRSVLMTGMSMGAILVDRQSFSLRLAAVAASIVIIWQPDSVLGASFQMSFAAVMTLIAFYEAFQHRIAGFYRGAGRVRRLWLDLWKIVLTTLVATLVTSPLALFHFQQEANYSLPANALAIPLNDFWIMPCALLAILLMPFGLDRWPLQAMGQGIEVMLRIAHRVAGWPGAITQTPLLPASSLLLCLFGLYWLIIWRRNWRWLGLIPIVAGSIVACLTVPAQIMIDADARRVAVRLSDGRLAVNAIAKRDFTIDSWQRLAGGDKAVLFAAVQDPWLQCGDGYCFYQPADRQAVVVLLSAAAAESQCQADRIVISMVRLQVNCLASRLIDPEFLAAEGATSLRFEKERTKPRRLPGGKAIGPGRPGLILPQQAHQLTLNLDQVGSENPGFIGSVGRLKRHIVTTLEKALQCCFVIIDQ